jgi:hypothetical protein
MRSKEIVMALMSYNLLHKNTQVRVVMKIMAVNKKILNMNEIKEKHYDDKKLLKLLSSILIK